MARRFIFLINKFVAGNQARNNKEQRRAGPAHLSQIKLRSTFNLSALAPPLETSAAAAHPAGPFKVFFKGAAGGQSWAAVESMRNPTAAADYENLFVAAAAAARPPSVTAGGAKSQIRPP